MIFDKIQHIPLFQAITETEANTFVYHPLTITRVNHVELEIMRKLI